MTSFLRMLIVMLLMLYPVSAKAAIDAAGAAQLKKTFESLLEEQRIGNRIGGQEFRTEGKVLVEPAENYYAVTLPHISLVHPDGGYEDYGIFSINVMPGAIPQEWKMTVAVPTPITVYNADKTISARIDIGGQSMTGVWSEATKGFTKMDARYENVVVHTKNQEIVFTIPKITMTQDLQPSGVGLWSGKGQCVFEGITAGRANMPSDVTLGKMTIEAIIENFNPSQREAFSKVMGQVIGESTPGTPMTPEQIEKVQKGATAYFLNSLGSAKTKITSENLVVNFPAKTDKPAMTITANKMTSNIDIGGLKDNKGNIRIAFGFDGVKISPAPAGAGMVIPSSTNFDITLNNLPVDQFVLSAFKDDFSSDPQFALKMLQNAGTFFTLAPSSIGNGYFNTAFNGNMNFVADAKAGGTGKITAEITGLNNLVEAAKAQLKSGNLSDKDRADLQGIVSTASVLMMTGQKDKTRPGLITYDGEITKDGKILINGVDASVFQSMTGLGARQPQKPVENTPEKPIDAAIPPPPSTTP